MRARAGSGEGLRELQRGLEPPGRVDAGEVELPRLQSGAADRPERLFPSKCAWSHGD
jgi:hypothetical protein